MPAKRKYSPSIPDYIAEEIDRHAEAMRKSPTEYLAAIASKWYADGCPPTSAEEARLRAERSPKAKATPKAS
jgi:hypothetical protein